MRGDPFFGEDEITETRNKIVHIVCMALAAGVTQLFLLLCLFFFRGEWSAPLYITALVGATVLNIALLTVDIVFYCLKKEVVYKSIITCYVMLIFFSVTFYILL